MWIFLVRSTIHWTLFEGFAVKYTHKQIRREILLKNFPASWRRKKKIRLNFHIILGNSEVPYLSTWETLYLKVLLRRKLFSLQQNFCFNVVTLARSFILLYEKYTDWQCYSKVRLSKLLRYRRLSFFPGSNTYDIGVLRLLGILLFSIRICLLEVPFFFLDFTNLAPVFGFLESQKRYSGLKLSSYIELP